MMTLLIMVAGVNAQKIDQRLTRLVEKSNAHRAQRMITLNPQAVKQQIAVDFNADGTPRSMSAIATLKDGAECPTEQLEQMGIKIRYQIGDMVVLNVPADKLLLLEDVEAFSYVSADEVKRTMNERAREATNVAKVNAAAAAAAQQLPQAYTGNGVVIGIIDNGIDYNHAAFRNADGTTRIKKVIDFSTGVKKEYTTDEAIKTLTTDTPNTSHGTHTSATAGGSDLSNGQQGMAPQAELVLCGLGGNTTSSNIVECIKDIFDYAGNKPAVVNISLGTVLGLHDGSEPEAKAVATLTENGTKAGRAVVMSPGNAAGCWQSIVKKLGTTADELKTVLGASMAPTQTLPLPVAYNANYCFYADDYQDFSIELKVVDLTTGEISEVGNHTVDALDERVEVKIDKENRSTLAGGNAIVYTLGLRGKGFVMDKKVYRLIIVAKAGHDGQTIMMTCDGDTNQEPCFDAPDGLSSFTKGNGDFAFSTSICNDYIISVGAYITRSAWENYSKELILYPESKLTGKRQALDEIADFSSYGVDDNGKARPTLLAPGQGLISGANNYDENMFSKNAPGTFEELMVSPYLCSYVEKHGRQNWYMIDQGTSMSAPVVTGIVALWMQAKPTLTVNEILSVMQQTCVNDEYTTDITMIPSGNKVQAGWGKIDCLAGLKTILGVTGIETINMDGHREATPSTMYNVDAPVYNMMGQRVDKNTRGLVIYKGRKYVNK